MPRIRRVWLKRHQWYKGKIQTRVIDVPETSLQHLNFKPVESRFGNEWFVRTSWWRHRTGWLGLRFKIQSTIANAIAKANKSLETPIGKLVLAIIGGAGAYMLGRYLLHRFAGL